MGIELFGVDAFIVDGKVIRGVMDGRTVYPYIKNRKGGWDNASGELSVAAFKARWKRDTVMWS